MSKVLLVYCNLPNEPLMPLGIASLYTVLDDAGHEVRLFDTIYYDSGYGGDDQKAREESGQVEVAFSKLKLLSHETLYCDYEAVVIDFNPDVIGFSCTEATYCIARLLFTLTP